MHLTHLPGNVAAYLQAQSSLRRERVLAILQRGLALFPDAQLNMKFRMPTLERAGAWCGCASERQHITLYVSKPKHLRMFLVKHPDTKLGSKCLHFGDYDAFPLADLDEVLHSALGGQL